MPLTRADIDRWDPAAVLAVSEAAAARAESAAAASARLAALAGLDGWGGVAGDAAREAVGRIRADLEAQADEARDIARAAEGAAARIARIKNDLHLLGDDTEKHSGADDPATRLTPPDRRLREVLAEATALDAALAQALTVAAVPLPASGPPPLSPPPPVPPGESAADVATWWNSLSPTERTTLLAEDPVTFGSLDGIPAADRDSANRRVLDGHLRGTGTEAGQHANALRVADALDHNAMRTGADVLLLTYQPTRFGGQGRAAIAIGNPDTAAHTTVMVPGTGNSVTSGWLSTLDAANLFGEAAAASGSEPISVVAWMGYDAPDSMLDPRVATPGLAHRGAALLAADVNALNATRRTGEPVTVVGHSYGSTTVADAAAGYGMRAGDVVLVGSPGTDMARTATDFHLPPGGHVYVGSASTDPVTTLSGLPGPLPNGEPLLGAGLGADPTADGFGSTRFKAEVPGFTWQTWTEHSRYFDPGSEALFSIAGIAAGDGARLQDHGMTAPHRSGLLGSLGTRLGLPSWSSPLADPELLRPATSGHFHTGAG